MKIVHLCLYGPVVDGWNYQDNLLPSYHQKMGHQVCVIASKWVWGKDNKLEFFDKNEYFLEDGVKMIRLDTRKNKDVLNKFKRYIDLEKTLKKEKPDLLFVHNPAYIDVNVVVKYLKENPCVKVVCDNHNDFSNTAQNFLSKNILHKFLWRKQYKKIIPFTSKFYGTLPARVEFLEKIYNVPKEKTELMVMGGDDELMASSKEKNSDIREKHGIGQDDFLIVSGGKIDEYKFQILYLMEAVRNINSPKIKLLIFGSVSENLKEKIKKLSDETLVKNIGWISVEQSYDYFQSADLVVFPGRHSVFWEQVVAQKKPMLCKHWNGTTHVDIGGNVQFLHKDSVEEIQNKILDLVSINGEKSDEYIQMLNNAQSEKSQAFSYGEIARKCVEI